MTTRTIFPYLKFVIMGLLSLLIIIPLLFILLSSVKTAQEAALMTLALPSEWKWSNFTVVFEQGKMLRGLTNSAIVTGGSVLLTIAIGVLAAFILARRSGKFMIFVYLLFVAGLIAPPSIIPTIKFLQMIHLNNQFVGVILLYAALHSPFIILMMTGFVKSIPKEIDESAFVDGSRGLGLFIRIIFPLLLPSITTATVFVFLGVWNDFQWPLYLLGNSEKWTIPMSVYMFKSKFGTDWNYVFADLIIAMLPVLLVYSVAQKFIIEEMTAGAIKG
ncbi:carbohydrate ABC transporter permease [Paenibacillus nasutitermitis]|uniref:Sugar ABC transporter permease n=1 Tax=Paenibacillus nasutitermitis TaxID=1652958 RepID=A0A917DSB2_9BACL|nr:carbohydrate ABC transporter permease [Paenibacillus nasutitermitis]GGD62239.1 sugar ABC transporter permease [Paenibacillus nasutitermitis]